MTIILLLLVLSLPKIVVLHHPDEFSLSFTHPVSAANPKLAFLKRVIILITKFTIHVDTRFLHVSVSR
ncbi:hypothetical protein C9I94_22465 [Photobacterium swingsii]|uniref:Uncharacterized protein n=1 Tax=Photobacterium swingsii TaxID=680026 RepID=A0A2T3NVX6_9GAMM|nr:hypothetical protein C9I94_22465 [Photobacterium swingsii]